MIIMKRADFISLHVPLNAETKHLINAKRLQLTKSQLILLNFARDGIVDKAALRAALDEKRIGLRLRFPLLTTAKSSSCYQFAALGGIHQEAEETCAVMAVKQLRDFLEQGIITNSVNFPRCEMPFNSGVRLAIVNANVPSMVAQISTKLASANLNIIDLVNKSREEIAYTLVDIDGQVSDQLLQEIATIKGVIRLRRLQNPTATHSTASKAEFIVDGTQAEYVRIPYADTNEEALVMLSDILPTGFECGVQNGKVQPGNTASTNALKVIIDVL